MIGLSSKEQIKKYVANLQSEIAGLIHANPRTLEEIHQMFLLKKQIVGTVLDEARIDENRVIRIKFRTNFLNMRDEYK